MKKHWPKYTLAFALTGAVFVLAWGVSFIVNREKINHLQETQDKIATDILSSEAQFDLLQESGCENSDTLTFAKEIASLADKISYSEKNLRTDEVIALKKQYSILEIKDFLLVKRIGEKCKHVPPIVLYFYGTEEACPDCVKQGYVLDAVRQKNPEVRIYAFDANLDLSSIGAMKTIYKIGEMLPTLVVNGTTVSGYQDSREVSALIARTSVAGVNSKANR